MTTAPDLDVLPLRPGVRAALREARAELERLYGDRLVKIVLFGSQARGDAHDESDVDVLVVLRGRLDPFEEARRTSGLMMRASSRHGVALSILHLEEAHFLNPDHPLMMNVKEEGIAL